MNQQQVARQLKYLLQTAQWSGGTNPIFGKVIVTQDGAFDVANLGDRPPIALVRVGSCEHDPDNPEIVLAMDFDIDIVVHVSGDPYAENALIGGNRTDLTASQGRGVTEVVAEALQAIQLNGAQTGITILSKAVGRSGASRLRGDDWCVQTISIVAKGGTAAYYHPARKFSASGSALSWTNPPARFDLHAAVSVPVLPAVGSMVLRYAAGSTAPASATAGSGATISAFDSSYTHGDDGQGSGTFSYALFAGYDLTGDGTINAYSEAVTLTGSF